MNRIIGLTGNIATGKSTVSDILKKYNYNIIDADLIAKKEQSINSKGLKAITNYFGKDVLNNDKSLNRNKLGKIVFNNSNELKMLTRIIDPFIRNSIRKEIKLFNKINNNPIVLDAPTLFENGYQYLTDKILFVYCDSTIQMKRLINRNNLSISDSSKRMASQWPMDIKIRLSDVIINNSYSFDKTKIQLIKLIKQKII